MTLVQHRNDTNACDDLPGTGDALRDDWLGFARYLADAVTSGEVTIEVAWRELVSTDPGIIERRALCRAAELAETELGATSLVAALLRAAAEGRPPEGEHHAKTGPSGMESPRTRVETSHGVASTD
jgi:hypothetical protein